MTLRLIYRWLRRTIVIVIIAGFALLAFAGFRPTSQDLPWTTLDLAQPIGLFTPRKLVELGGARGTCLKLLRTSGIRFEPLPPRQNGHCDVANAVRLSARQAMLALSPASVAPSCPVIAGLLLWQTQVVQPLAQQVYGKSVVRIEHLGSYSCRRIYGRAHGSWSEHSTANAIDVSAFVLSDGTRISVQRDWAGNSGKARFLHAARDGACTLFSTVLSPDYNAAHHDHLHIDLANRGPMGWRACR